MKSQVGQMDSAPYFNGNMEKEDILQDIYRFSE